MQTEIKMNQGLELWGGIECTINRVKKRFIDQLSFSDHYKQAQGEADIDLINSLGIKMLRYPILWEKHQPIETKPIEWSWITARLEKIRSTGITPIAGLVHHGSGPAYTNLLDPNFPDKLAKYAKAVATEFPWIEYYTPVNEPLTTARFSGLYGLWYPHGKNDVSFAKMFINEMKGVVLSMQAIREVNPNAKLVQTEDLGKTYCSPGLKYQAKFENERRWLTFDILSGNIKPGHRIWAYFRRLGIQQSALDFFLKNPCPPDIIGINYYITSERFIDEATHKYPSCTHGGNELQEYADTEAVRVKHSEPHGLGVLLKEAWDRFQIPIAITEVHLSCTREEQMRWFKEIWETCLDLKINGGVDIRAVTAWALFGSFGWNKLLTSRKMDYESGAFDIRGEFPRITAIGHLIKSLGRQDKIHHPLFDLPGWWHRDLRLFENLSYLASSKIKADISETRPVLILGKTGTLGKAFARICDQRNIKYYLLSRQELDITDPVQIEAVIDFHQPWAVINAAGFVRVDDAEDELELCFNQNTAGPEYLAAICEKFGVKFLTFSSDLVFDGRQREPYTELNTPEPLNIYGWSKAHAETKMLAANKQALVIRTSAFFGPWDEHNFVHHLINTVKQGNEFPVMEDARISPTYVPHLVNHSLDLMIDDEKGIWHLTNQADVSWYEFAKEVAARADLDESLIRPVSRQSLNLKAARPAYTVLASCRGQIMPTLDSALDNYFNEVNELCDRRVLVKIKAKA